MLMPDVNILIYAYREESHDHLRYRDWFNFLVSGPEPFALSSLALQGFVRIVTNPRAYEPPSPIDGVLDEIDRLLELPNCRFLCPGPRHWGIFKSLCMKPGIRGTLVSDAAHAALAIEHGCEWITADTDFARFAPELRWRYL